MRIGCGRCNYCWSERVERAYEILLNALVKNLPKAQF